MLLCIETVRENNYETIDFEIIENVEEDELYLVLTLPKNIVSFG